MYLQVTTFWAKCHLHTNPTKKMLFHRRKFPVAPETYFMSLLQAVTLTCRAPYRHALSKAFSSLVAAADPLTDYLSFAQKCIISLDVPGGDACLER